MIGLNKMVQRKVPLGPKQLSMTHLWRGEGLLYTNMYQGLTFDQSCTCRRAVYGAGEVIDLLNKMDSQGSQ